MVHLVENYQMDEEQKNHPIPVARPLEAPIAEGSMPRRVRVSIEGAWKEASSLAETMLDTLLLPAGGFSVVATGWLTSALFFALSIAAVAVIGLGGLVLFVGLECLALMAYAYPGTLFLVSVAGGLAPPLVLYWLIHSLMGIQGDWTGWGAYPLLLLGLFGSYYYWRFGRFIATTGAGALAFYRGAAPKAGEILGAPFAVFSAVWEVIKLVFGLIRGVALQLYTLLRRRAKAGQAAAATGAQAPPPPSEASGADNEGRAGE